jgi:hypothetical protein
MEESIQFKYFLHAEGEDLAESIRSVNPGMSQETAEAIADTRPFYEVTAYCEFTPRTNSVEILFCE